MPKILLLAVLFCCVTFVASAQEQVIVKGDSLKRSPKVDTAAYVNLGKVAAKKAAWRSAIVPGWGQVSNGLTIYRGVKVAAIYAGGTLLAMSYISNNRNYHEILSEVQYREENGGVSRPGSLYPTTSYQTAGLIEAKDLYRRNREVVVLSFVALYGVNIIEAYIDARLKYFDIDNNLAIKISPSVIGSNTMYGYNSFAPALKIAFRL